MREYTIKQLSEFFEVTDASMRTWLGGYDFTKYIISYKKPLTYGVTKSFCTDLILRMYKKRENAKVNRVINNAKYLRSLLKT